MLRNYYVKAKNITYSLQTSNFELSKALDLHPIRNGHFGQVV